MRSAFSIRKFLSLVAIALSVAAAAHADDVTLEGKISYRFTRANGGRWKTSASIQRISNYSYSDFTAARAVLVLSKKAYASGVPVTGQTVSTTQIGNLPARTYFDDFRLAGVTRLPKGRFFVLMLVVDGQNRILGGATFQKTLNILKSHQTGPHSSGLHAIDGARTIANAAQ